MKKAIIITLSVLVVIGVSLWLATPYIAKTIEGKLQSELRKAGLNLEYSDFQWHYAPPGATLSQVRITHASVDSLFEIKVNKADFRTSWDDVYARNWTNWSRITLDSGSISIFKPDSLNKIMAENEVDTTSSVKIDINRFGLSNIKVFVEGEAGGEFYIQTFTGSWVADKVNAQWHHSVKNRPLAFTISEGKMPTIGILHGATVDTVTYDMKSRNLRMAGINIKPHASRSVIDRTHRELIAHMNVAVPEVLVTNFNWSHSSDFRWRAGKVQIKGARMDMYQNNNKPRPNEEKPLPPAWIKDVGLQFLIDTFQISGARLAYSEVQPGVPELVQLVMDRWHLTCFGYGTDTARPKSFTIYSQMRLLGSEMKVNATFPYGDPNYRFSLNGTIGPANFQDFNSVIEPTEGIHFRSGQLKSAKFNFNGNNNINRGTFSMNYEDVKVGFSREPTFREKLKAFGANTFVVKTNKLDEDNEVEVVFVREKNKSFVNYWWQSVKEGFVEALKR